jgi:hypothetical protein
MMCRFLCHNQKTVMAGLVPATHRAAIEALEYVEKWVAGTSPAMTV